MQGEYRGDFTRDTFNPKKQFSRVLMQQGRVLLDADWNEQTAILLHYLQTLARDIIGPHGGPGDGFKLAANGTSPDFNIGAGHYYVDGILCENDSDLKYTEQKNQPPLAKDKDTTYLAYLDVWERHVTYIEENKEGNPGIREVALGGPDTCTRAQIVWQVKVENNAEIKSGGKVKNLEIFDKLRKAWQPENRGWLKARATDAPKDDPNTPCIINPSSSYRGTENQLYRVEIHTGGKANEATFKWSRENGSVIFPVLNVGGSKITLAHLGRDARSSLQPNDWVELVDDDITLRNQAGPLAKVKSIQHEDIIVEIVAWEGALPTYHSSNDYLSKHVILRRWEGKQLVTESEGTEEKDWLKLEDGVQIQFQPKQGGDPAQQYRPADYWLIPARVATGDVEWPGQTGTPDALPPHGVEHHYAPLAIVKVDTSGNVTVKVPDDDLRNKFSSLQP